MSDLSNPSHLGLSPADIEQIKANAASESRKKYAANTQQEVAAFSFSAPQFSAEIASQLSRPTDALASLPVGVASAEMSSDSLYALNDAAFVQAAYQLVLARAPDTASLEAAVQALQNGHSRQNFIAELGMSKEGQQQLAQVSGERQASLGWVLHLVTQRQSQLSSLTGRWGDRLQQRLFAGQDVLLSRDFGALDAQARVVAGRVAQLEGDFANTAANTAAQQQQTISFVTQSLHRLALEASEDRRWRDLREFELREMTADLAEQAAAMKHDWQKLESTLQTTLQAAQTSLRDVIATSQQVLDQAFSDKLEQALAAVRQVAQAVADQSAQEVQLSQATANAKLSARHDHLLQLATQIEQRSVATDANQLQALRTDLQQLKQMSVGRELDRAVMADFYEQLERRFRGSREQIKALQATYVERVQSAIKRTGEKPVIDLGCGRGEWLELMRDHNIKARGIDMNERFVTECRQLGLTVDLQDAFSALAQLPDKSVAAVTAFHLIEHLPVNSQLKLALELKRVVHPGGIVILETPNPENLKVGACNFYLDPTHRNPLPPFYLQFLLDYAGFTNPEIIRLHAADAASQLPNLDNASMLELNHQLNGPMDYAVIGTAALLTQ
jgi:2-polyprenyl-3-methyl-5-hydroxy-6-metoxy-1,4-benzoquinol methylase